MMLRIADVLPPPQLQQCRDALTHAEWVDGRSTAGHLASHAKRNLQLPLEHPLTRQIGELIVTCLLRNPEFIAAALPNKVLPPRFNRYEDGGEYGDHIDNAIFAVPGSVERVRSDLSATLFFSSPDEYDGGELVVQDQFGEQRVKLPAGHLVLYPGTSLHRVTPVTRGTRYAAFFWIQSLIRDDARRSLMLELDQSIQALGTRLANDPALVRLTGVYHNLLRQWAEV
ncbi:Fe2+-dependent dioxygenase [Sinimarinibacterium sp. NLF-5-8]|uniref:Fe2+-dependent dioxygenase n=1 Tax=Sinimarinibacterium sp. NLF-5-8 TaxID=2698684 RepID=UPI00137C0681|nr:Fe2+-dependent dioxygenase [Sinimarinibacterium sp. NLF-5-8]QHS10014.1 Fe2+-dependent dioxygenase [Sinimarinibacterium sp. NLF-5-8]